MVESKTHVQKHHNLLVFHFENNAGQRNKLVFTSISKELKQYLSIGAVENNGDDSDGVIVLYALFTVVFIFIFPSIRRCYDQ